MFRRNRPPHIYLDETYYFFAARTIFQKPFLNTNRKKNIFLNIFKKLLKKYQYSCQAWIILNNHYHLMLKVSKAENLKMFIKDLHSLTAKEINKLDGQKRRKIWWNYWDKCIRNRKDFWTHVNYIHHNPVKHGYVKEMNKYKFSSYQHYLKKYGEKFLISCFAQFPVIDFSVKWD